MLYLLIDFWRTIIDIPDLEAYYRTRVERILEVEGLDRGPRVEEALNVYRKIFQSFDSARRSGCVEIPADLEIRAFLSTIGGTEPTDEHLEAYSAPMLERTFLKEGVAEALEALKEEGHKLVVVTNTPYHPMVEEKIRREGLSRYFEAIVSSHSTGIRKPCPGIFRVALSILGANPDNALMIGDSFRDDIQGGSRMGLRTIWFSGDLGAGGADATVNSWKEVVEVVRVIA